MLIKLTDPSIMMNSIVILILFFMLICHIFILVIKYKTPVLCFNVSLM